MRASNLHHYQRVRFANPKLILPLALCVSLCGCILFQKGPDEKKIKPIQEVYADQLSKLSIGMGINQFSTILPQAYVVSQNQESTTYGLYLKQVIRDNRRQVDAYLGLYNPKDIVNDQALWFYFQNGALVRWGSTNDFPVIERGTR